MDWFQTSVLVCLLVALLTGWLFHLYFKLHIHKMRQGISCFSSSISSYVKKVIVCVHMCVHMWVCVHWCMHFECVYMCRCHSMQLWMSVLTLSLDWRQCLAVHAVSELVAPELLVILWSQFLISWEEHAVITDACSQCSALMWVWIRT